MIEKFIDKNKINLSINLKETKKFYVEKLIYLEII